MHIAISISSIDTLGLATQREQLMEKIIILGKESQLLEELLQILFLLVSKLLFMRLLPICFKSLTFFSPHRVDRALIE